MKHRFTLYFIRIHHFFPLVSILWFISSFCILLSTSHVDLGRIDDKFAWRFSQFKEVEAESLDFLLLCYGLCYSHKDATQFKLMIVIMRVILVLSSTKVPPTVYKHRLLYNAKKVVIKQLPATDSYPYLPQIIDINWKQRVTLALVETVG